ncbi:MAG: DUF4834 family protein [Prevotella sp.]|nr:DUF4834 family protein [Prevotella sp.]MBQ9649586.1 DUF4834 family protein [Prevotella sp.]
MIKFVFGAIIFGLIAISVIILLVINFTYRSVKKLREEAEDNYYRNQRQKEQKEKRPFSDDYFKSSKGGSGHRQSRTQAQYEQREQPKRDKNPFGDDYFKGKQQEQPQQQAEKKDTARKTTTSSGVTIIDDRDTERKIFDHSDGEYVEFEEV